MDVAKSGLDQDSLNQSGLGSESTHPLRKKPGRKKRPFILCDICGVDLKHHKSYYKVYKDTFKIAFKFVLCQRAISRRHCILLHASIDPNESSSAMICAEVPHVCRLRIERAHQY